MLFDSVPGHHVFNQLQPPQTEILFHSVPKTNLGSPTFVSIRNTTGHEPPIQFGSPGNTKVDAVCGRPSMCGAPQQAKSSLVIPQPICKILTCSSSHFCSY